jgi:hypothetical protein
LRRAMPMPILSDVVGGVAWLIIGQVAPVHRPEIDLEPGEGAHGLRHKTTREVRCAREQERERSDGSGYTASTAALRAPLNRPLKMMWTAKHW